MTSILLKTIDGEDAEFDRANLAQRLGGALIGPTSPGYDSARAIWNAMIDRKPGLIVQAKTEDDVCAAVKFAAENSILLAVRSGGHNIAGTALCEGGLVLDLRALNTVTTDPAGRTACVGPGATLGDVDKATQAHGLVVPTGINSTTGIAGLTLGGGFGWTTRKFGLTIDQLAGVRLVTAKGDIVVANHEENADLFWAVRGGGGNFGIVTEFLFNLQPLGLTVYAGMSVYPLADIQSVAEAVQALEKTADEDLTTWLVMRKAPPLEFLPPEWHGREVVIAPSCYIGPAANGEAATRAIREIGVPIAEHYGEMPFTDWQASFDPLLTEGARNYWKSHDVAHFDKEALQIVVEAIEALPTEECEVFFGHVGRAATVKGPDDTAFPNREPHFAVNMHARWRGPEDDAKCIAWARSLYERLAPHAMGTRYVNFVPEDNEASNVECIYGENLARLTAVKKTWDPANLFRTNINLSA